MEATATRAQLLWEALSDTPPERVAGAPRAAQAEGDPAKAELVEALDARS